MRGGGRSGGGSGGSPVGTVVRVVTALASVTVLLVVGYGWREYRALATGLTRTDALDGGGAGGGAGGGSTPGGDSNILVMGLDSRLDQNGDPLPPDVLAQLHAGDSSDGGYNTNVLMLLHLPADGGPAQAVSIPRDDYVALPGAPDGVRTQKIKQAYGLAKDAEERRLRARGVTDRAALERQGREAGRRESIATVRQFLGGVPVDHVVEVTLVGFYDLARALGSVTVCLRGPTQDSYSGARFVRGYQRLDASQSLAFVRQRRDYVHPELNFTDLDRERRQQAFLASAAAQLRGAGVLADPSRLAALIGVAERDVVLDSGLDPLTLLRRAHGLLDGQVTFTTLPVASFGKVDGQDVNLVDLGQVRATVRGLLGPDDADGAGPPAPAPLPAATVDVVNASGRSGLAAELRHDLGGRGLTAGRASTDRHTRAESEVRYPPGGATAATALAAALGGLPVRPDAGIGTGHEQVLLGTRFTVPAGLSDGTGDPAVGSGGSGGPGGGPAGPGAAAPAVPATSLAGGGIPCVT
ncbi:MAG TPA: LCP family protein [Pseudonocardia sp.]